MIRELEFFGVSHFSMAPKFRFIKYFDESRFAYFQLDYRPDRMTYAVTTFIEEKLHPKYVENRAVPFEESYTESGPATPVFFILSPGVDPLKDVERVGKKLGFTFDNKVRHSH